MKRFIFTASLVIPLGVLTTCHKHTPGGTAPDNTDQDYFECKVDGVQWGGILTDLHLNYYCACDSILNISAYRQGNNFDQEIHLISDQAIVGDTGNVVAGVNGGPLLLDYVSSDPCAGSDYYPYRNGKVFLQEHNTEKGYLKGTFWIYGKNANCPSDTVMEITEGRFLVHY